MNSFEELDFADSINITGKNFHDSLGAKQKHYFLSLLKNSSLNNAAVAVLQSIAEENNLIPFEEYVHDSELYLHMENKKKIVSEIYIHIGRHFQDIKKHNLAIKSFNFSLMMGNHLANYFIARLLETTNSREEALEHYRSSSILGHVRSSFKLAVENLKNTNYTESKTVFLKLLEQGCASAMNNLAYMYLNGLSVNLDYIKASKLLEVASFLGSKVAKFNLANMHRLEKTLEKNEKKEKKLFIESGFVSSDFHQGNNYEYLLEENLDTVSTKKMFFPGLFSKLNEDETNICECKKQFKEDCDCSACKNRIGLVFFVSLPNSFGKKVVSFNENIKLYTLKKYLELTEGISSLTTEVHFKGVKYSDEEYLKNVGVKQNSEIEIKGENNIFQKTNLSIIIETLDNKYFISTFENKYSFFFF